MPLRAHLNGKDIFTFDFDTDSWNELKRSSKHLELQMPCCDSRAVPKTSKLGNSFFSHKAKGDCVSEAESQEHLFIKSAIAQAAIKAGWGTTTEKTGKTPAGEQWIADVFCIKGKAKVVFEVQLSKQTKDETVRRQDKYRRSGVRCAWIVSEKAFADYSFVSNKEVPFFRITEPRVSVIPKVKVFDVALPEFIEGLLEGQLKWQVKSWKYGIYYVDDVCWSCRKENKQICGYTVNKYINRAMTVSSTSTLLKGIIDRVISNNELIKLGLNTIAEINGFKSKMQDFIYCNHCLHCGEAQRNEHLIQKIGLCADKDEVGGFEVIGYTSAKQQVGSWVFHNN